MTDRDLSSGNRPNPEMDSLVTRLEAERPIPDPQFRGELRRHLTAGSGRASAPRRLRLLITGYATGGLALLAITAIGVAGAGPFAA